MSLFKLMDCKQKTSPFYLMGFVADHLNDGDSHVAANAKADEKANGAEKGNGVAFGHVRLARTVGLH